MKMLKDTSLPGRCATLNLPLTPGSPIFIKQHLDSIILIHLLPPALNPQALPPSEVREVAGILFTGSRREGNDHLVSFRLF